jgi:hypothetical protein
MFHVEHSLAGKSLFSDAKARKDAVENIIDADAARDTAKCVGSMAQSFGAQDKIICRSRIRQRCCGIDEGVAMSGMGEQWRFGRPDC